MTTSIALPPIAGMLAPWAASGDWLEFAETGGEVSLSAISLTLSDQSASDVTIEIDDGTTQIQATILATTGFIREVQTATLAASATLRMRVVAAAGDAMGLSGSLEISGGILPSSGPGLITADEFFTAWSLSPSTAQTDFVQRMIDASSERIRTHCHRHFNESLYVEDWLYPSGTVYLTETPIVTLSALTADGTVVGSPYLNEATGEIGRSDNQLGWSGTRALHVEYTAGYAIIPAVIREGLYRAIRQQLATFDRGEFDFQNRRAGKISYTGSGSVDYEGSAGGLSWGELPDYIAGIPLDVLYPYIDQSQASGPPAGLRRYTRTDP